MISLIKLLIKLFYVQLNTMDYNESIDGAVFNKFEFL